MRYPGVSKSIRLTAWLSLCLLLASIAAIPAGQADARERDRTLRLFFAHTGEHDEFTFKRNGRYDQSEIRRLNHFLRDWRKNEDANMDPHILDLVWSIYREVGASQEIHVVSAYRSLATNNALRQRSSGVAKHSQHTLGKAMDFFIPGVPLAKLRATAMSFQGGGVGFYPTSGSPFVHVDTGNVRSWPRMTRTQLLALFPNGNTLYLPADGKPLPGYEQALARRQTQGTTALAYLETDDSDSNDRSNRGGNGGGWLSRVFGGSSVDEEEETGVATAAAPEEPASEPAQEEPAVAVAEVVDPRMPRPRPATEIDIMVADASAASAESQTAVEATDQLAMASLVDVPLPRSRPDTAVLAYSLAVDAAPAALEVASDDALAALAAGAQQNLVIAAQNAASEAGSSATAQNEPVLPSAADSAVIAGFAAIEEPAAPAASSGTALAAADVLSADQPIPQPRSLALAFAGSGLPAAEMPAPSAAVAPAIEVSAASVVDYQADAATLQLLLGAPAMQDGDSLTMPQPARAPDLFAVPMNADGVAGLDETEVLPANHFQMADASEGGFFSHLLASIVE